MNTDVNNSAHRRDSEEYDEDTDHQRDSSIPTPRRNNKYYAQSPPDYYNNPWAHSTHAPPVNYWPGYTEGNRQVYNNAPIGNYPHPHIAQPGYAPFGNYPPMGNFYQPPVAQGYTAVPNYPPPPFHPPPPKAQLGAHNTNPFSFSNLQQQPVVPDEVAGTSSEQPHPSRAQSPSPRDTVPLYHQ